MAIKQILAMPVIFKLFNFLIGAEYSRKKFINDYVCPQSKDNILDIGCGMAEIAKYIPSDVNYYGIDISEKYIATAKKSASSNMHLVCSNALENNFIGIVFDKVFMFGVLHHLDDNQCDKLIQKIQAILKPDGKFICIEPCYTKNQNWFAKWMKANDRGSYIRSQDGYKSIISKFLKIDVEKIHNDFLRIPYTYLVITAKSVKNEAL
jgi:SAM-dependent methyltransferase